MAAINYGMKAPAVQLDKIEGKEFLGVVGRVSGVYV